MSFSAVPTTQSMPPNPFSGLGGSSSTSSGSSGITGAAGQQMQQFLQLLVAQLQNQNPLQPMDNTQFVTQLAQFSTLQTLQGIQSSLDSQMGAQLLGEAMSLIGRNVTARPPNGQPVSGTVTGVQLQGSNVLLEIGNATVNLTDVQEIKAASTGG